jgi:PEP-CTERM motif
MSRPTVRALGLVALALTLPAGQARAGLTLTMQEVGPNVVMAGGGTLNLSGFSFIVNVPANPVIDPNEVFRVGAAGTLSMYVGIIAGPPSFGPGTTATFASGGAGDLFALGFLTVVGVPVGYVSGAALSGSAAYLGQSFSTLGVTPGTYTWTLGNGDTIALAIGTIAAVPAPSSLALLASGAACLAVRRRRGA